MNESSSTLTKLRKVIQSLQKEEMIHMQRLHGDALKQIVAIARGSGLTLEHIEFALKEREPKDKASNVPRKNKKQMTATPESGAS